MKNTPENSQDMAERRDTYLLKIYRRSNQGGPLLVGTVEEITGRKKGVFKTGAELLCWLDDSVEKRGTS